MKDKTRTKEQLINELEVLRRRVGELEAIVDSVGDPVSIQDTDFKVIYQNQLHKDSIGSHIGEYCYKAYRNLDSICPGCHLALAFRDGKIHKKEQSKITDKGTKYCEMTASPVKDVSGKIIAGVEIVRDITERKRVEQEREDLVVKLQEALAEVRALSGMLPICSSCKKIRDDKGYWNQIEAYISKHSEAEFTHGICPDCAEKLYPEYYKKQ